MSSTPSGERDLTPGSKLKAMFGGWSRDESAFYVMTNERDPRFFDVYRYDAGDYKRTLLYEDKDGYQVGDVSGDGRFDRARQAEVDRRQRHLSLGCPRARQMTHLTPHDTPAQYSTAEFDPDSKSLYYLTNAGGEFIAGPPLRPGRRQA